jgi:hypothetical protein
LTKVSNTPSDRDKQSSNPQEHTEDLRTWSSARWFSGNIMAPSVPTAPGASPKVNIWVFTHFDGFIDRYPSPIMLDIPSCLLSTGFSLFSIMYFVGWYCGGNCSRVIR